jgi:hypothetical protein
MGACGPCPCCCLLLQLFSRGEFARAVKQHSAERNAKGFTCWGQLVAMLFCQVAQLKSLREVCLACCEAPLKHLGTSETPNKSTLAYANQHRPWELYQTVFGHLLEKCRAEAAARGGRKKFRFKNKLMSLDGSIIDLSATNRGRLPSSRCIRRALVKPDGRTATFRPKRGSLSLLLRESSFCVN